MLLLLLRRTLPPSKPMPRSCKRNVYLRSRRYYRDAAQKVAAIAAERAAIVARRSALLLSSSPRIKF